jgi:GT2 family glycosyltransferase
MLDLSVIIVNYKCWSRLGKCLDSLLDIPQSVVSFEVIIVDNASDDGILPKFQTAYQQFSFIENSGNNGFAHGCNLGASKASGKYLLFLNPDTVVNETALIGLLNKAWSCKEYSIVSCCQVREDGSEEKPYGSFLSPMTLTGWLRALKHLYSGSKRKLDSEAGILSPDWVSGSLIMIKKLNFNKLKGWDEDFWMYFEDVDLCKRARDNGGDIILLLNVVIEHNHGGSSRINSRVTALTKTEVNISRHVYIYKHEMGMRGILMNSFLVINNLLIGIIPAILGLVFFFIKDMKVTSITYFSLLEYYFNALRYGTWLSPRSVNYEN